MDFQVREHIFQTISKSKHFQTEADSPSGWVYGDGVRLSCYVSNQPSAVWSLKLSHIYGIS